MKLGVACVVLMISGSAAMADSVTLTYAGSIASGHAAQATFTFDNSTNTVRVRIANTMSPAHDSAGARDLSALFWNFSGAGTLGVTYNNTPVPNGPNANTWDATNVTSTTGGDVNNPSGYNAEQLWAFRNGLSGAPGGASYGLSAAGLGLFGPADMLQSGGPPPQPAGPDGAIISPTGNPFNGGSRPQFRSFVEFEFGVDHSFFPQDLASIGVNSIRAQFNTSINPNEQVQMMLVPLPPAAWAGLGCLGIAAIGARRRWRGQRQTV
jgi:hypothetical protein